MLSYDAKNQHDVPGTSKYPQNIIPYIGLSDKILRREILKYSEILLLFEYGSGKKRDVMPGKRRENPYKSQISLDKGVIVDY